MSSCSTDAAESEVDITWEEEDEVDTKAAAGRKRTVGISSVVSVPRKKSCSCVRSSSCTRSSWSASTT